MLGIPTRAALYARFSSDNQRSESIDAQVRAMEAYCQQHQYKVVHTYIDEARSATTDRRPAFQQMIADSKGRDFDIVLVHKLDRFARNRYDSVFYRRELKKNGVNLYSVLERLDDSPESVIMEALIESMGEFYSKNLSRETMKGMKETAYQGKHTGGIPPLGYDVDQETRKLKVNPQEASTVQMIFQMYAEGKGYGAILDKLHQEGRKTKRGNEFAKNSLYSILANEKYQGVYIFNKTAAKDCLGRRNSHLRKGEEEQIRIEGGCPQIVSKEVFAKVRSRMQKNRGQGGQKNAKTRYLLSGKVYCKECGKAMVGNKRKGGRNREDYITYRCPSRKHTCSNREINRDYLEAAVVAAIEENILNGSALADLAKRISERAAAPESRQEAQQERLAEIKTGLKNIAEAIEAGLLSEALITKLKDLERQKAEVERLIASPGQQSEVSVDTGQILRRYGEVSQNKASLAYRDFLKGYISRVTVGRFTVEVELKTGLGVFDDLDTVLLLRRQAVYEGKGR